MATLGLIPLKEPVRKTIEIPGSKSYTNRALIMSAMTPGKVVITNPLFSDDTEAMTRCLIDLGIKVRVLKSKIIVEGDITQIKPANRLLNAKISGTAIRFLTALSCLIPGEITLEGEEGLNKRPIGELVEGLRQLGADIEYLKSDGFPPVKIKSSKLKPGETKLNGDISSQYFSALLMVAPFVGGMTIRVLNNQISKPYIDMTIDTMQKFGVIVDNNDYKMYQVKPGQKYDLNQYEVEGDYSSAGYFLAIAALTGSEITLKNLNIKSKQADRKLTEALKQLDPMFKVTVSKTSGSDYLTVKGSGNLKPVHINMEDFPDQVQTVAVLAAFANGKSVITGVRSLRVKETERVLALQNELTKMGIKTNSTPDSLTIYGGNPGHAIIDTYGDHRMAMSFAVAGSKLSGIDINNPEVVTKTFPEFWSKLKQLGLKQEV